MAGILTEAHEEQHQLSSKKHFEQLDGLRGAAAFAVVIYHTMPGGGIIPNAFLAVDLFFLLSGFVIAYSYDDRLGISMSPHEFLVRRIIRLYPMILVGALGGIVLAFIHNKTNPSQAYPLHSIVSSGLLSLVILPYLVPGVISDSVFSFNVPLWSLFFEIFGNVAYAFISRRANVLLLSIIVFAALLSIGFGGPLGGGRKWDFWGGFPRIAAGFFGGVLLFRLWRTGRLERVRLSFAFQILLIGALFALPFLVRGWLFVGVFILMGIVIIGGANARPSKLDSFYALLGGISYPLYLTNTLVLYVLKAVGKKFMLTDRKYIIVVVAELIIAPLVAYCLRRAYEYPVLLRLNRYSRQMSWTHGQK